MSKSRGVLPYKSDGVLVVPFRGLHLWIGTAQGAKTENDCCQSCLGKNYDNTFKKFLGKMCSKVMFSTIKFAVPVIKFVVVELNPRGGNEFGIRP